ncbi:MAG: nucleotidyltransferase domain-containing protein [Bacteroidetes bacterium]|nr:nucleotidyltransferase domain-containing protein [Bacteroidota bacterium]
MDNLGNLIRKLRKEKELPLRTVAAYLDIDQAILSKIERGQRKAKREHILKLARYFKVAENDLLIAWLSDKLVYEVADENIALKALQVAEEKVAYTAYQKKDKKAIENTITDYFKKDEHIMKAWLFGSFARGEDDYYSDIDVMIEVKRDSNFSLFDLAEIQYNLERLVPQKFDIVMKEGVTPNILERIKPDLKVIYEG